MFGDSTALHVMTFNLRYAAARGADAWPRRRPVMAELLRREQPAVVGTQEGLRDQLTDLDHDLPDHYDRIGQGREGGDRGEFTAVLYDTRRVTPSTHGDFWLSDTPDVPGSASWGNVTTRMVTWVRFTDRPTGREFAVVNTHLDNLSEHARVRGAELLRDRVAAFEPDLPVIVTGDFNAPAGRSAAYGTLTAAGLADTWTAAATHATPRYATFHGYGGPVPDGDRIDWILTRGTAGVPAAGINTFAVDGQFPSDHFPVQALVSLA
ncbi:endonuclease/exonuclease/phosphatase family protein [Actinophytocola oryzae]|uniref:Endonuclease/exonuclease/phosphatase family metal-dependent hydrolase n=1 Tax=Actinophytocola oryzae TaxID=502181 RepID=A0A4R7VFD7_9PSEU|nr:endonuclease/exonuclease/phosphatase family protein [Actinophytocola oryzae]TDV47932.1 endonuclease/exonuclease/phosphatase family metal-dependent hydrolase [Actinophytocola oryzae]